MSRAPDLARLVASQIAEHSMLRSGERAVVGVSGGADSVALLLALHELRLPLTVAHLDHGLRPDSAADAAFVGRLAADLRLPAAIERRDVGAYRRAHRLTLEAAARAVRHAFLREVAARQGAAGIFLGHTADDQVETFLLRLLRGAGPAGLAGMRPKVAQLCRPLLGVWRHDVEAFLRRRNQPWIEDPSNEDPSFLRNRVRHELLPLMMSMNPGVKEVLLRECALLARRHGSVEAELYRQLGLGSRQIARALLGQTVVLRGARYLDVRSAPGPTPPPGPPFDTALPVPGEVYLEGIGSLSGSLVPGDEARALLRARSARLRQHEEYVDAAGLILPLDIRGRRAGDRFVPLGMHTPKKLQDFFVDEHVPRPLRSRVPLVTSGDAIVWVVGLRIDERFKVTPQTAEAVHLQFVPE